MNVLPNDDIETLLFLYFDGELSSEEAKAIELLMESNEQAQLLACQIQENQHLVQNYFSLQQAHVEQLIVKRSSKQRVNLFSRVGRVFCGPIVAYSTFVIMTTFWPMNHNTGNMEDDITRNYLLTMQLAEQVCKDAGDSTFYQRTEWDTITRV